MKPKPWSLRPRFEKWFRILRKWEGLQHAVNLRGFHIMLGTVILSDGFPDFLNSTHIHSFPFVVVAGLRVAAALVRLEVEDMALDHTGIPLDFDFPALLAEKGGLIPGLREKQPHFIAGAAAGTGTQNGKLDHPASVILKTLHVQNVVSFQLTG
ncbi:hypothetical protein CLOM621_07196 [Clostridium sp. M62/1]|nr:hypothetical protein CLOM621_07196 [Clostridium sp. M62/1]